MSETRERVYKAHLGVDVGARKGYSTFCHYGHLTECGRYVDGGSVMWPVTADWCPTEREALARLAPQLYAIGARLIAQANELLEAAKDGGGGMTQPRLGYSVTWEPRTSGSVYVSVFKFAREGDAGWFANEQAAKLDAADRMSKLAHELMRQASFLREDPRGL